MQECSNFFCQIKKALMDPTLPVLEWHKMCLLEGLFYHELALLRSFSFPGYNIIDDFPLNDDRISIIFQNLDEIFSR
jgi:hypothetical protein